MKRIVCGKSLFAATSCTEQIVCWKYFLRQAHVTDILFVGSRFAASSCHELNCLLEVVFAASSYHEQICLLEVVQVRAGIDTVWL